MNIDNITLHDIYDALEKKEFVMYYQPKISLLDGVLIGYEALIRWIYKDEVIGPYKFIPLIDESNFTSIITHYVIDQIISDYKQFEAAGFEPHIAFNISPIDLQSPRLIEKLHSLKSEFDVSKLQIEITESVIIGTDDEVVLHNLNELTKLGLTIALDDFGTGFSSLEVLKKLPITTLKLDRCLITNITDNERANGIISSIIRLAHAIDVKSIAEGVEDELTYKRLLFSGCKQAQGYFISKPLPLLKAIEFQRLNTIHSHNHIGIIYQTILDHIEWRKDVIELFYFISEVQFHQFQTDKIKRLMNTISQECNFGKWYYGIGTIFKDWSEYQVLEKWHDKFHAITCELLLFIMGKELITSESMSSKLQEFNYCSSNIISKLLVLEHKLHLTYRTNTYNYVPLDDPLDPNPM